MLERKKKLPKMFPVQLPAFPYRYSSSLLVPLHQIFILTRKNIPECNNVTNNTCTAQISLLYVRPTQTGEKLTVELR